MKVFVNMSEATHETPCLQLDSESVDKSEIKKWKVKVLTMVPIDDCFLAIAELL